MPGLLCARERQTQDNSCAMLCLRTRNRSNGECATRFSGFQFRFEETRFLGRDRTLIESPSVIDNKYAKVSIGPYSAHSRVTCRGVIINIEQRLCHSIRDGLGDLLSLGGLLQVLAQFVQCPQVWLHFEQRFRMES